MLTGRMVHPFAKKLRFHSLRRNKLFGVQQHFQKHSLRNQRYQLQRQANDVVTVPADITVDLANGCTIHLVRIANNLFKK